LFLILETAINIGYSCKMLADDMVDIFIVDGHKFEDVKLPLEKRKQSLSNDNEDSNTVYATRWSTALRPAN
jgi:magnesium-transporting ATPase (P-type)